MDLGMWDMQDLMACHLPCRYGNVPQVCLVDYGGNHAS
jgi:hypothetical protein